MAALCVEGLVGVVGDGQQPLRAVPEGGRFGKAAEVVLRVGERTD